MTVCKHCQAQDSKLRRRYRDEFDEPFACACGYDGKLEIDHEHQEYPYPFRAWRFRSCNLKAREPWVRGPAAEKVKN